MSSNPDGHLAEDDLDFIEPAPRRVPRRVRRHVLFGDRMLQFGWPFFGLGFIMAWFLVRHTEIWTAVEFAQPTDFAQGRVLAIEDHTDYEDGSEPSFAIGYTYEVGGVRYENWSFASAPSYDPGERVSVEFLAAEPSTSRIEGLRVRAYAGPAWGVPIFPLVGLLLIGFGIRRGRRRLHVLTHGRPALGTLVDKQTIGRRDEQPTYFLTFAYRDHTGREHRGETQVMNPASLEDDARERLLYDPLRPQRIVLLDELEGAVRVDARGRLVATGLGLAVLILPLLSMAAVVATVMWVQ